MAWAFVLLDFSRFHRLSQAGLKLLASLLKVAEERLDEFGIEELRQLGQVCASMSCLDVLIWGYPKHAQDVCGEEATGEEYVHRHTYKYTLIHARVGSYSPNSLTTHRCMHV